MPTPARCFPRAPGKSSNLARTTQVVQGVALHTAVVDVIWVVKQVTDDALASIALRDRRARSPRTPTVMGNAANAGTSIGRAAGFFL